MISSILQHTPLWVWALLAGLVALGVSQIQPRKRRLPGAMATPVIMTALSLLGAATTFVHFGVALSAWTLGAAATLCACIAAGAWRRVTWSSSTQRIELPGSWAPLILILAIFAVKYVVGVTVALHPERAADATMAAVLGLVYGAFSGVFMSRGYAMLRAVSAVLPATRPVRQSAWSAGHDVVAGECDAQAQFLALDGEHGGAATSAASPRA